MYLHNIEALLLDPRIFIVVSPIFIGWIFVYLILEEIDKNL